MNFKILPRYIDGIDQAPESARKTNKVYLAHEEFVQGQDGIAYVTDANADDVLLTDPQVESVADKLTLAEELINAAIADAGGAV